jgi:hypothetical protein
MSLEIEQEMLLSSLQEEVQQLSKVFQGVVHTVKEVEKISNYPIFIAHQQANLGIGVCFVDKKAAACLWAYHISTLEELVNKQILSMDKVDDFRQLYKSKMIENSFCVFMLHERISQWLFVPVG